MAIEHIFALLLIASLAGITISLARRIELWRQGKKTQVKWSFLLLIPKRYFVDLHHVVLRDPYIAWTHIAAAGGAVGSLLLLIIMYLGGILSEFLFVLTALCLVSCFGGGVFVLARRLNKPSRLSGGRWKVLPFTILAFSVSCLTLLVMDNFFASSAAWLTYSLAACAAVSLFDIAFAGTLSRPFKHILTGSLNLAFHPRQERFDARQRGEEKRRRFDKALKPLKDGETGIRTIRDFAWNRLLNFDACVECGKCEVACPAFAAEQPLNPKKLIQDMVASMDSLVRYAGSPTPAALAAGAAVHSSTTVNEGDDLVGSSVAADTLWSCTTCGACVQECPMFVEHVDTIVDLRRNLTLEQGRLPAKSFAVLENLRHTDNAEGGNPAQRADWALDLDVRVLAPGESTSVLLYAGNAAYELRNQNTLRSLVRLLQRAKVDFALLGNDELDVGDLARRLGDESLFRSLVERNVARLAAVSFERIVTADPHVYHSLKNEYPAYGGDYEVVHHTELLLELVTEGKLRLKKEGGNKDLSLSYHDPCYLGRYNGVTDAPRLLLKTLGMNLVEMDRNGMRSRCCGWGGGAAYSDIPGKKRIPDMRMDDAREKKVDTLVVACPNCMTMLEGVVEPRPQVLDIVEVVSLAVDDATH